MGALISRQPKFFEEGHIKRDCKALGPTFTQISNGEDTWAQVLRGQNPPVQGQQPLQAQQPLKPSPSTKYQAQIQSNQVVQIHSENRCQLKKEWEEVIRRDMNMRRESRGEKKTQEREETMVTVDNGQKLGR